MSEIAEKPWTIDQFFAWQEQGSERYELVNGFPLRMMAGAKNVHDDIVVNLVAELRDRHGAPVAAPSRATGASRQFRAKSAVPTPASIAAAATRTG